jgi:hypothetical protein
LLGNFVDGAGAPSIEYDRNVEPLAFSILAKLLNQPVAPVFERSLHPVLIHPSATFSE